MIGEQDDRCTLTSTDKDRSLNFPTEASSTGRGMKLQ
jgi:hypothetical protein